MSLVKKETEPTLRQNLIQSSENSQLQNFKAFDRAPLLTEIPDQGQVLAMVSGTLYLYTKYKGARYRVAYAAAP